MRLFLTGAAGFIGSHVARLAVARGHEVCALVRSGSDPERLRGLGDGLTLVTGDLGDRAAVSRAVADAAPEAAIHAAWYAVPGKYLDAPQNVDCLEQGVSLLRALAAARCRRVVMVGTCAEYDTSRGWLHEDGPTRPDTLYSSAKLALKLVAEQVARQEGVDVAWARVFYLYGPDEPRGRMVPSAIEALLAGRRFSATLGEQVRDYLHVHDVASALVTLAEQRGASGAFNVASGEPITIRRLMDTLGDAVGRRELIDFGAIPYRAWDPPFVCGDSRRLRATGWAPHTPLGEGLLRTAEWWRARSGAGTV